MVWIFKTNVYSEAHISQIKPHIEALNLPLKWSLDTEDCDNVLRIECEQDIRSEVLEMFQIEGFYCAELE